MRSVTLAAVFLLAVTPACLVGCQTVSDDALALRSDSWDLPESLLLESEPEDIEIVNPEFRRQLMSICRSAEWQSSSERISDDGRTIRCRTGSGEQCCLIWHSSGRLTARWPNGETQSADVTDTDARWLNRVLQWTLCQDALERVLAQPADGPLTEIPSDSADSDRHLIPTHLANVPDGIQYHLCLDERTELAWLMETGGFAARLQLHGPWQISSEPVNTLRQRMQLAGH